MPESGRKASTVMAPTPLYARFLITLLRGLVWIYDILSYPFYYLVQKPYVTVEFREQTKAKHVIPGDPNSSLVRVRYKDPYRLHVTTVDEMFRQVVSNHSNSHAFGSRICHGEEQVPMPNGKIYKKLNLGDYVWLTYSEADKRVTNIAKGLLGLGLKPGQFVTLYAETRLEWMLTALACFRIKAPVVTIYATLGEDGVVHGLQETESEFIVTSAELMPRLTKNIDRIPLVRHVVYMEGVNPPELKDDLSSTAKFHSFASIEKVGQSSLEEIDEKLKPSSEDIAIIMYTSGSTGVPKGVVLKHQQVIAAINEFMNFGFDPEGAIFAAYLPLSHIYEFSVEFSFVAQAVPIGYSSPQTLTSTSTAIKSGCPGDVDLIRPTHASCVPLILDRIRKNIEDGVAKQGAIPKAFFDFAVRYKSYWYRKGFGTPILDRLVFFKTRKIFGGRCRYISSGGAPIAPDTQEFVQAALCTEILQGYGMTETTSCGSAMLIGDRSTGIVGPPVTYAKVKLVDWPDGKYFTTDKPNPRGEIMVGGDFVAVGYYKNPELTSESFTGPDAEGTRWFITGDIGEILPNGNIKIIDRKKDLVKLQFGEYISLGKVESALKTCGLVDNVCAFGNSYQSFLIALISPNKSQLKALARELGKPADKMTLAELCADRDIENAATKAISEHGLKCKLSRVEVPTKYRLCSEEWLPDTGLVTAALKIRRKMIEEYYKKDIEELYGSSTN